MCLPPRPSLPRSRRSPRRTGQRGRRPGLRPRRWQREGRIARRGARQRRSLRVVSPPCLSSTRKTSLSATASCRRTLPRAATSSPSRPWQTLLRRTTRDLTSTRFSPPSPPRRARGSARPPPPNPKSATTSRHRTLAPAHPRACPRPPMEQAPNPRSSLLLSAAISTRPLPSAPPRRRASASEKLPAARRLPPPSPASTLPPEESSLAPPRASCPRYAPSM